MGEDLKVIVPAIIALIGTLIVAYLGYRQWKRQGRNTRDADYLKEKQTVYKELWERLEEVHVRLRTEKVGDAEFRNLLQETNTYVLKKQLFLEEEDRNLANKYLNSIREFTETIRSSKDREAKASMEDTGALPSSVLQRAERIRKANAEVEEIRGLIIKRFKKFVGAN